MTLIEELDLAADMTLEEDPEGAKLLASAAGALRKFNDVLSTVSHKAPGYDWNSDPENLTLLIGEAFRLVQSDYE